jgi:uncharacterized protein (TIGR04222 family)
MYSALIRAPHPPLDLGGRAAARHTVTVADDDLTAPEIALIRAGGWAAAQTALAMLVAAGCVVGAGKGQIMRTSQGSSSEEPLVRALYSSLYGSMGPRELTNQPRVQATLRDTRRRLRRQGYLRSPWVRTAVPLGLVVVPPALAARLIAHHLVPPTVAVVMLLVCLVVAVWLVPRRSVSGSRLLRRLRVRYPAGSPSPGVFLADRRGDEASSPRPDEAEVGRRVALYGVAASMRLLPAHAAELGLIHGGRWNRRLDIPEATRGSTW